MAELFSAMRDAYIHGNVATGKAKPKGTMKMPWYMRSDKPVKGKSGKDLWDAIDGMMTRLRSGT